MHVISKLAVHLTILFLNFKRNYNHLPVGRTDTVIISIISAVSNRSAQRDVFGKKKAQSLIEAHALVLGLARGVSRDHAHVDQCVTLPFA